MIVCYGEILVDTFREKDKESAYVGGAPFNFSYAAHKMGDEVLFVGNIGKDKYGEQIERFFKENNLDSRGLHIDPVRKTTLSRVTLKNGERDFTFLRNDTADDAFPEDSLDFLSQGDIIHLGSLMLSSERGRAFAKKVIAYTKEQKKILSFDINFRSDIFKNKEEALKIYNEFYPQMDIVKFSKEELSLFTGTNDRKEAIARLEKGPKLILVTLGKEGSEAYYRDKMVKAPSISIKAVDTTGAGDCFFGTFISEIDSFGLEESLMIPSLLESSLRFANIAGAMATTKRGALSGIPTYSEVEKYLSHNPKK